MAAYYSLLIIGLCLLMGYAGQISLGHAGFFAIGGYLSAALTTRNLLPLPGHTVLVRLLDAAGLLLAGQDLYGEPLLVVHALGGLPHRHPRGGPDRLCSSASRC